MNLRRKFCHTRSIGDLWRWFAGIGGVDFKGYLGEPMLAIGWSAGVEGYLGSSKSPTRQRSRLWWRQ